MSKIDSSDKNLTILISALSAFNSLISFAVQAVILKKYGVSCSADAYYLGIGLPGTVTSLLAGILVHTLTPELKTKCDWGSKYQSNLMGLILGFSVISVTLALMVATFNTPKIGSAVCRDYAVIISWIYSACIPITILTSVFSVIKQVDGNLKISALIQPWPSIAQIIMLTSTEDSIPIYWQGVSYLIGCVAQLYFVAKGFNFTKCLNFEIFFSILKAIPLTGTGLSIFVLIPLSDLYWAVKLPQGSIAYLANCQRIIVGITGLVSTGVSTVILNRLSSMHKSSRVERADYINDWLIRYCFLIIPLTLTVSASAADLVKILFMRGMFSEEEANSMALLLSETIWGMIPMGASTILFRALFAEKGFVFSAVLGVSGIAIYFGLSGLLIKTYGLEGIAVSYIIVWCLVVFVSKIYLSGIMRILNGFINKVSFFLIIPAVPLLMLQKKLVSLISVSTIEPFFVSLIRVTICLSASSVFYLAVWIIYNSSSSVNILKKS